MQDIALPENAYVNALAIDEVGLPVFEPSVWRYSVRRHFSLNST